MARDPFFDAYLPEQPDPFERWDHILNPRKKRKPSAIQPLEPEEEESLLGQLGGKTLSAVGYLGSILDKPGRIVRGLLAGKPREALNIVPFSDAWGLTDHNEAVGGRDLLEQWGMLGKNQEGFDAGDVAGFAAEMALDPLTYLGGLGALGRGGKAVQKAGLLKQAPEIAAKKLGRKVGMLEARSNLGFGDFMNALSPGELEALKNAAGGAKQLAALAAKNEPLSGLSTIGLPGFGPGRVIGTGDKAQHILRGLDKTGAYLRASAPVRYLAKKFNPEVRETTTLAGQQHAADATREGATAQGRASVPIAELQQEAYKLGLHDDHDFWRGVTEMAEQTRVRDPFIAGRKTADAVNDFLNRNAANPPTQVDAALRKLLKQTGMSGQQAAKITAPDAMKHLTDFMAKVPAAPAQPNLAQIEAMAFPGRSPEHIQFGRHAAQVIRDQQDLALAAGEAVGVIHDLGDWYSKHIHRQVPTSLAKLAQQGREEYLKNIPRTGKHAGGTSSINAMIDDAKVEMLMQTDPKLIPQYLRHEYLGVSAADTQRYQVLQQLKKANKLVPMSPEAYELQALEFHHKQADWLAKEIQSLPAEAFKQKGLFVRSVFGDHLSGQMGAQMAIESAKGVHGLLADVAEKALPEGVTIKTAFGPREINGVKTHATGLTGPGAYRAFAEQLVKRGKETPQILQDLADPKTAKAARKILDSYAVPAAHLEDAGRIMNFHRTPKASDGFLDLWDKLTNTIKAHQTVTRPAFWSRNLLSLMWQDAISGGISNPLSLKQWVEFGRNWHDSIKILRGDVIPGMADLPLFAGRNLTDAEATKLYRSHSFAHKIAPRGQGEAMHNLGQAAYDTADFSHDIPGLIPRGLKAGIRTTINDVKTGGWNQLKPWRVRGGLGGGNPEKLSEFAWNRGMERANSYIEGVGRNATFLRELRKGTAPEIAAAISKGAHVDYSALTGFERSVMQRLFPYYTYTRRMTPWVLRELAERPSGPIGQAMRLSRHSSESENFSPPQVAGGVAIPLGDRGNGTRRYLTTDLPHESLNDLLAVRPTVTGTVQHSGMALASQLHPFLKAPAEVIANKSFFQRGRPLTELHSPTATGNILVDQLITNSPANSYLSIANTLRQPRDRKSALDKAINVLAGVHLHDVDSEKAKNAAVRETVNELLRGSKNVRTFENLSIPADQLSEAAPEQIAMLRLLKTMSTRSRHEKNEKERHSHDAEKRRRALTG